MVVGITACRNPRRMGEELFPPPPTRTDTLQLSQATQLFLPAPDTRNAPFVFVGQTTDTFVGTWSAAWATQFSLGGQNVRFITEQLLAVDSVVLELFIASSYGNIGTPMRVRVSRLLQPLSPNGSYPADATFPTDGQSLVLSGRDSLWYVSFVPGVRRFPLDTTLGREILTLPPSALVSEATFQAAFPGLYVEAEPFSAGENGAVYTLLPRSPLTVLRIFYRELIQGREAAQRYDFFVTDSVTWAYRLSRSVSGPAPLRDQLASDPQLGEERLLVSGGWPTGVGFQVMGWERIARRPVLSAQLIWPSDSASLPGFSAFYPRPGSLVLYADTTEEVATASWGFGDFFGNEVRWNLTQPVQEIALGRRTPPNALYLWPAGRTYTLQRWVAAGLSSATPPYLVVTSAEP